MRWHQAVVLRGSLLYMLSSMINLINHPLPSTVNTREGICAQGKPFVRAGRKATDLGSAEAAGLPQEMRSCAVAVSEVSLHQRFALPQHVSQGGRRWVRDGS